MILRNIILDPLAREMRWQGFAATLLALRRCAWWQASIRQWRGCILNTIFKTDIPLSVCYLLGFIKGAIFALLTTRRKPVQPRKRQLFLEFLDAIMQLLVLRSQRRNFHRGPG